MRTILIVLVVVLAIAAIGAVVADYSTHAIRNAPAIAHETVADASDTVRVVLRPHLANAVLLQLLADQHVPGWLLSALLPREVGYSPIGGGAYPMPGDPDNDTRSNNSQFSGTGKDDDPPETGGDC